jgi:hypothetical protein
MKRAWVILFMCISVVAAPATLTAASESDANSVIAGYVRFHKKWKPSQYRIEHHGREKSLDVYWVIWIAEERRPYPGGGKSFEVFYDSKAHQVVRELGFQ